MCPLELPSSSYPVKMSEGVIRVDCLLHAFELFCPECHVMEHLCHVQSTFYRPIRRAGHRSADNAGMNGVSKTM